MVFRLFEGVEDRLGNSEELVGRAVSPAEAGLVRVQLLVSFQPVLEPVLHQSLGELADGVEEADWPVAAWESRRLALLGDGDYLCGAPTGGNRAFGPATVQDMEQLRFAGGAQMSEHVVRHHVRAGALSGLQFGESVL